MRLTSFLTAALSIHCSYILAAQTEQDVVIFIDIVVDRETPGILKKLSEASKNREPPECLAMLEAANVSNSVDRATILDAMVDGCISYLRYAFWKMTGVLPPALTEDGEEDIVAPLSIDWKNKFITIGGKTIDTEDLAFSETGCMPLLLSYFWGQGWLVSDGTMGENRMIPLYTSHILAADSPELLERLLIKAPQNPNHFLNKINNNRNDDWNTNNKVKKCFLGGVIFHDAVKIYRYLIENEQLLPHNLHSQDWRQCVFKSDAVRMFKELQYPRVEELCLMYVNEGTKILTVSLERGIRLSIFDALRIFDGNRSIQFSEENDVFINLNSHHNIIAHITASDRGELIFKKTNRIITDRDTLLSFSLPSSFLSKSKFDNRLSKLTCIQSVALVTFMSVCLVFLMFSLFNLTH